MKRAITCIFVLSIFFANISTYGHCENIKTIENPDGWTGGAYVDLDTIKILTYDPPIYILEVELGFSYRDRRSLIYRLNYDMRTVEYYAENKSWVYDRATGRDIYTTVESKWIEVDTYSYSPVYWKAAVYAWEKNYGMHFPSPDDSIEEGDALFKKKQYNEAIEVYKKAILHPGNYSRKHNGKVLFKIGNCYYNMGNYDAAIKSYGESVSFYPDGDNTFDRLGDAYYMNGKYNEAIEAHSKAISINPDHPWAYTGLGWDYFAIGEYKKGIDSAGKGIKIKDTNPSSYYIRGLCYEKLGKHKKALDDFEHAVSLAPKNELYTTARDRVKN